MSGITTHVLDTSLGRPAAGVPIMLELARDDDWQPVGDGVTDDDGRLGTLLEPDAPLEEGTYRITFDTSAYFDATDRDGFYPSVQIAFYVRAADEHYHVPLLLNPFGYSTYRGS